MNLFVDAFAWLFDPLNWQGSGSIPQRINEHLGYSAAAMIVAVVIAVPLGWWIGHTGRGKEFVVGLTGAARALPSFGLLFLFVMLVGVQLREPTAVVVLMLLAVPPILAGAYSGFEIIDRRTIDAARAVGMTEWQIVWKVEVPLGLPLLFGGLRSAVLQVVATTVLVVFIGLGGLGFEIVQGIELRRYDQMLGSAMLVIALALILDAVFALLERYAVPRGVRAGRITDVRTTPHGRRATAEITATT